MVFRSRCGQCDPRGNIKIHSITTSYHLHVRRGPAVAAILNPHSAMLGCGKNKPKRKRVVLTLEKKLEVIKMLGKAVSCTIISEKFGIGHSTFGDIKRITIKYYLCLVRRERNVA